METARAGADATRYRGEGVSAFHARSDEEAEGEAEACRGEYDAAQPEETSPHWHTLRQGRDGVKEELI